MKRLFPVLASIAFILTGCSNTDDFNQSPSQHETAPPKQAPMADHLVGEWVTVKGQTHNPNNGKPYLQGEIQITKEWIDIRLDGYDRFLILAQYNTSTNLIMDCYYAIYILHEVLEGYTGMIPQTVIKIGDAVVSSGRITLQIDGETIAVLVRKGSEPEEPITPEEPETPVVN